MLNPIKAREIVESFANWDYNGDECPTDLYRARTREAAAQAALVVWAKNPEHRDDARDAILALGDVEAGRVYLEAWDEAHAEEYDL